MSAIINEAKMLVAGWHDEASHTSHLDFIYEEWVRAATDERRQEVRGQVGEYIRILNNYADRLALAANGCGIETSSLIDLRLPVSHRWDEVPTIGEPQRPMTPPNQPTNNLVAPHAPKKAGHMPPSPPPSPALLALSGIELSNGGNIDEELFYITLDYLIEAAENVCGCEEKMSAYTKIFEFLLTQPIQLVKNPELRELSFESLLSTSIRVPGHVGVDGLLNSFRRLFVVLRRHPYYVPHPSSNY